MSFRFRVSVETTLMSRVWLMPGILPKCGSEVAMAKGEFAT
jgi:hypothetical protein